MARTKSVFVEKRNRAMGALYSLGATYQELAESFGVNITQMPRIMRSLGIVARPQGRPKNNGADERVGA